MVYLVIAASVEIVQDVQYHENVLVGKCSNDHIVHIVVGRAGKEKLSSPPRSRLLLQILPRRRKWPPEQI